MTDDPLLIIPTLQYGCDLSGDNILVINGHQGGSVLLPCSCSDLRTKPQTFTWRTLRTKIWTDVLNDEHYRGRLQLFNNISPGNLSLLISDLRVEDGADYWCRTEKGYRDMKITVTVFGIVAAFLLVIVGAVAFICWRCKGGRCGEKVSPEGCLDYKIKLVDQIVSDATLFTTVIYTCYSTDPH
ncbi:hypothetical protein QTP86_002843 [Hemibagrus guttatus]|nr:hypothetical protein QTP86_002843 [Hemibagrus guttatus]